MRFRNGIGFVDRVVERRFALQARPELDGGVQQEPNDVSLLLLVVFDHELPPAGRGLPRDALERITGAVLTLAAVFIFVL